MEIYNILVLHDRCLIYKKGFDNIKKALDEHEDINIHTIKNGKTEIIFTNDIHLADIILKEMNQNKNPLAI